MRRRLKRSVVGLLAGVLSLIVVLPMLLQMKPAPAQKVVKVAYNEETFIQTLLPHAKLLSDYYGIRTSVILAQVSVESNYGRTLLSAKYHNLYKTKAQRGQASVSLLDSVVLDGKTSQSPVDFVVYKSWQESMDAYMDNLKNGKIGDTSLYRNLVTSDSYQQAARIFQEELYSTDSDYANQLIKVIDTYKLSQYDKK